MKRSRRRARGFALILVLIVVAMISLSTYTFCSLMVTENESAVLSGRQVQARALVDSGAAQVRYFLELDPILRRNLGGGYDNPQLFQAQLVVPGEMARTRARFGVVSPRLDGQGYWGGLRFGLQDESSRLNLNALNLDIQAGATLDEALDAAGSGDPADPDGAAPQELDTSGRGMLMKLPGMTIDVADAILDWIDADDEPREYGAEIDYYSSLTPSYSPQNGPLKTVEDLLLVRGMTPNLLFGRDINRNGLLDAAEMNLPLLADVDLGDGSMDFGWSAYLTLHSQEKNVTKDGEPRIDLNGDDMQQLFTDLSAVMDEAWATFIVAYRQRGPYTGNSNENVEPAGQQTLDLTQAGQFPLTQVLDLIGVRVQIQSDDDTVIVESPFADNPVAMSAYLPKLMDVCTVNSSPTIPGRVNINRAPRIVLLAIPGMTTEMADMIINQRDVENNEFDDDLQNETWLLSRAVVTLDEMRTLMPFVTAGGDVYRAQIIGYFDSGEISSRAEVIFDATTAYPRIVSWRDISHLGRGYARETLGVEVYDNTTPLQ